MMNNNRYRYMRLIAMYDLPFKTKVDQRNYNKFHSFIINNGFVMIQYSIYAKLCLNYAEVVKNIKKIEFNKPKKGNLRLLQITEKQYEAMKIVVGEKSWDEQMANNNRIVEL